MDLEGFAELLGNGRSGACAASQEGTTRLSGLLPSSIKPAHFELRGDTCCLARSAAVDVIFASFETN